MTEVVTITDQEKQIILKDNQEKRKKAVEEYTDFIDNMIEKDDKGKSKKQVIYRLWLRNRLYWGAEKVFETEGDEYDFVGKFGKGMFDEDRIRKF